MVVNNPLVWPYFLRGWHVGGTLRSHEFQSHFMTSSLRGLVVTQELFSWIFTCALVRILNNNEAGVFQRYIYPSYTKKESNQKSLSFPAHFGIKLLFFGTTFVPGFPQSNNRNSKTYIKFLFRMWNSAFYWIFELGCVGALTVFFEIDSSNSSTRSWWFSYL